MKNITIRIIVRRGFARFSINGNGFTIDVTRLINRRRRHGMMVSRAAIMARLNAAYDIGMGNDIVSPNGHVMAHCDTSYDRTYDRGANVERGTWYGIDT